MATKSRNKKVTFSLDEELLIQIKELVAEGIAGSQKAFVEEALRDRIAKVRRDMLRQAFAEASRDPLFLKDIAEIEEAFRRADAETAAMIP